MMLSTVAPNQYVKHQVLGLVGRALAAPQQTALRVKVPTLVPGDTPADAVTVDWNLSALSPASDAEAQAAALKLPPPESAADAAQTSQDPRAASAAPEETNGTAH